MPRKSLSIDEDTHKKINRLRAKLIAETGDDIVSYTTMANVALSLGVSLLDLMPEESWQQLYPTIKDADERLVVDTIADQFADTLLKVLLAKQAEKT